MRAPETGNIVGYEDEVENQHFWLQDIWGFQETDPVRERHYSLRLPPGWEYKASWLSYPEVKPGEVGGASQWVVSDVKGIRQEPDMPPVNGVAGQMIVSFFPAAGTSRKNELANWADMGNWYGNLVSGRMGTSEPHRQQVTGFRAGKATQLQQRPTIAGFVEQNIH